MKVIFLDIDGVLNTNETIDIVDNYYRETGIKKIYIDEFRIEYLRKIVEMTDAKIVLSSSLRWRFKKVGDKCIARTKYAVEFINIFEKYGLFLYDVIPKIENASRQDEIRLWLSYNDSVDNFVILDDESVSLMDFVGTNLIVLNKLSIGEMVRDMRDSTGLCERHVDEAINILNGKKYCKSLLKNKKIKEEKFYVF